MALVTISPRRNIILIGITVLSAILVIKLFVLQVIKTEYKISADNNVFKHVTIYPTRGIVYDRNMVPLIENRVVYDIMLTPTSLREFDTTLFCNIFSISKGHLDSLLLNVKKNSKKIGYQNVRFLKNINIDTYSKFAESEYKFNGFSGEMRNMRVYPSPSAGSILGYLEEVNQDFIETHPGYKAGDYVGKGGIEESYESYLRGEKGDCIYLKDVHNRIKASYNNGLSDKNAVKGKDIIITIDSELQAFGEELMKNKVGALVALDPTTGEILALISSPTISADQLADMSSNYMDLVKDPLKPLFNRAVMSGYPPGSVFKTINGLIGLQMGLLTPETLYPCNRGYHVGRGVGCHSHPSPIDFRSAIMMSCNAYFCYVFRNILDKKGHSIDENLDLWKEYVNSFGFGHKLGSDILSEKGGNIPSSKTYNNRYRKGGWNSLTVISLSIGQGEVTATPLQIANLSAIIANKGYYFTPHLIKAIPDTTFINPFTEKHYTMIDEKWFDVVREGMYKAVNSGQGAGGTATVAWIPHISFCGKTGTAQNPHGADNSVFMGFAPMNNPKICVAAYIEKGGFGATNAAPIASLLVEKYLTGTICPERQPLLDYVKDTDLMYKFKR